MKELFADINYLAILAAGVAYWLVGMVWFSFLFGKTWSEEIQKMGIKLVKPSSQSMAYKSILTFIFNLISCFAAAIFVRAFGINFWQGGLILGLILGLFFSAMAMATSYVWVSRSIKLSLIDIGYPIVGTTVATIILAVWN